MRERECFRNVAQDRDSLSQRKPDFRKQLVPQRLSDDKRHHEIRQLIGDAGSENWNYVRMLKLCREQYLALESLRIQSGRKLGRENLDDHGAAKRFVIGDKDARHAAP